MKTTKAQREYQQRMLAANRRYHERMKRVRRERALEEVEDIMQGGALIARIIRRHDDA